MFSAVARPKLIQTLDSFQFDLLVIGGGITGAGIALDAVTRGLSVALIDMQDFAAGTSSRSTNSFMEVLLFKTIGSSNGCRSR